MVLGVGGYLFFGPFFRSERQTVVTGGIHNIDTVEAVDILLALLCFLREDEFKSRNNLWKRRKSRKAKSKKFALI